MTMGDHIQTAGINFSHCDALLNKFSHFTPLPVPGHPGPIESLHRVGPIMKKFSESHKKYRRSEVMRPTKGPQKETGQLGGFNDKRGAQSRVNTNRWWAAFRNGAKFQNDGVFVLERAAIREREFQNDVCCSFAWFFENAVPAPPPAAAQYKS